MREELDSLLNKYSASMLEITPNKHCIKNDFCQIDFLKERYDDGFVVVVHASDMKSNLYPILKNSDERLKPFSSLEELMIQIMNFCDDILQGDYRRLEVDA